MWCPSGRIAGGNTEARATGNQPWYLCDRGQSQPSLTVDKPLTRPNFGQWNYVNRVLILPIPFHLALSPNERPNCPNIPN